MEVTDGKGHDPHPHPTPPSFVSVTESLEQRARQIVRQGIAVLDAAHLAAAEIGGAEIVLTCDDVLVRRAARLGLALRVLNPVAYFNEVKDNG